MLFLFYLLFANSLFSHFLPLKSSFGQRLLSPIFLFPTQPRHDLRIFLLPLCEFFLSLPLVFLPSPSPSKAPALSSTRRHFHPLVHLLQCIKYASGFEARSSEWRQIRRSLLCQGGNAGIWLLSSLLARGIESCSEKFHANNLRAGSSI